MKKTNGSSFQLDTDLLSLRSWVAVVEEGSFSAAAKKVGRTQSAVSLQIAKLEERIGARLMERTSRRQSLTAAGEIFLSYAKRILGFADEAILAVTSPRAQTTRRVGLAEYLAPFHLHDLLGRFRRAHPNCDLRIVLNTGAEMIRELNRGKLDMVLAGPEADNGELLWEEPLVWTGKVSKEVGNPIELVLMPAPCSYRQIAFDALSKTGRAWKISIEANSVQTVQAAIRAGFGVSLLPLSAVGEAMPVVKEALPALPDTSVMSYLASGSGPSHPYSQRLIDFLLTGIEGSIEHRRRSCASRNETQSK